ncbi:hypothetical protein G0Q06_01405 [Puniceicoccales bacterium CK1056]|uniref:Membrane protein YkgB n=1 Tax=Oceanipulchritudo coccoides TaxID=2706888 RepID=A0A6B2LYE3_9BACT|nr:hypothetical protein [Oceanipulchritudo coccoides]NDV61099.1 hypothetical protein [Oceanipulchritudo coccoides]
MTPDVLDQRIIRIMKDFYPTAIRLSFAVIFIWFGILKPLGLSAAEPLVLKTVAWMPFLSPHGWLSVIGWWEVAIGLLFFSHRTTRLAILLLFLQMGGTFLPLFILSEVTFQKGGIPFLPTMEGQYIIKNLMILSGALVLGSHVRTKTKEVNHGLKSSSASQDEHK